mmetsp:Transcript_27167/g.89076  ORF Transcript_27167/g.89076 Transcript_27167/m.89076 type:complete len:247 (-) Transcript_27167:39-779(-)
MSETSAPGTSAAGRISASSAASSSPSSPASWYSPSLSLPSSSPKACLSIGAAPKASPAPAVAGAEESAHSRCLFLGCMSSINSWKAGSFGSPDLSPAAFAAASARTRFSSFAAFIASRAVFGLPSAAVAAASTSDTRFRSAAFADEPSECFDHGRGSAPSPTFRASSTVRRCVSRNVWSKNRSAADAAAVVLNPTKAICRERPSLVRTILTSVSSASTAAPAKCSRRRASSTYFGTPFTHRRVVVP